MQPSAVSSVSALKRNNKNGPRGVRDFDRLGHEAFARNSGARARHLFLPPIHGGTLARKSGVSLLTCASRLAGHRRNATPRRRMKTAQVSLMRDGGHDGKRIMDCSGTARGLAERPFDRRRRRDPSRRTLYPGQRPSWPRATSAAKRAGGIRRSRSGSSPDNGLVIRPKFRSES